MPSLIPKKLRRYKRDYPYSYPLLFFFLEAAESLVKLGAIAVVFIVGYLGLKSLLLNLGSNDQNVVIVQPESSAAPMAVAKTEPGPPVQIIESSVSSDQSIITPEPERLRTDINQYQTTGLSADIALRDEDAIAWITSLSGSDFIIQFAATPDEKAILDFTRDGLTGEAVIYPFKRTPSGRPVYGVASTRVYSSLESAQRALTELPEFLREGKPWIRPASQVQQAVASNL